MLMADTASAASAVMHNWTKASPTCSTVARSLLSRARPLMVVCLPAPIRKAVATLLVMLNSLSSSESMTLSVTLAVVPLECHRDSSFCCTACTNSAAIEITRRQCISAVHARYTEPERDMSSTCGRHTNAPADLQAVAGGLQRAPLLTLLAVWPATTCADSTNGR